MKFRKKAVLVEAVQLRWDTWDEMCAFANVGKFRDGAPTGCYVDAAGKITDDTNGRIGLRIPTLEGTMLAVEGDWIIRGVEGALYPCKPSVFAATYEPAEDPNAQPSGQPVCTHGGDAVGFGCPECRRFEVRCHEVDCGEHGEHLELVCCWCGAPFFALRMIEHEPQRPPTSHSH